MTDKSSFLLKLGAASKIAGAGPLARKALVALLPMLSFVPAAHAQVSAETCGPIANAYGPFDYRTQKEPLVRVEQHHFTLQVEQLIRGQEGSIGGDLDYTLRASPNHHRALVAMMRFGDRLKADKVQGANYLVECYFERALRFRPDDTSARLIYATFLIAKNRKDEALSHVGEVVRRAGDNPFAHYNAGLVYIEMKEYDLALERAHVAAGMGMTRPQLRTQLEAAGRWREPAAPAAGQSQRGAANSNSSAQDAKPVEAASSPRSPG